MTLGVAEFVDGWRQTLQNMDAVHHQITNHVISLDGDEATCAANMQGIHVLANASGGPMWTVGGRHDYQLKRTPGGWRIAGLTFTIQWATGNMNVLTSRWVQDNPDCDTPCSGPRPCRCCCLGGGRCPMEAVRPAALSREDLCPRAAGRLPPRARPLWETAQGASGAGGWRRSPR